MAREIEGKIFPNVGFYSGMMCKQMGIPSIYSLGVVSVAGLGISSSSTRRIGSCVRAFVTSVKLTALGLPSLTGSLCVSVEPLVNGRFGRFSCDLFHLSRGESWPESENPRIH